MHWSTFREFTDCINFNNLHAVVLFPPLHAVDTPSVPMITVNPLSISIKINEMASLICQAVGSPKLTYTWFKDDKLIQNAMWPYYSIPSANISDRGYYHCSATNGAGTATSQRALLSLRGVAQYLTVIAGHNTSQLDMVITYSSMSLVSTTVFIDSFFA